MIKLKSYPRRTILLVLCLIGISLLFTAIKVYLLTCDNTWKEFETSLHTNEVIIDAVQDNAIVYMVTSQSGNTDYGDTLVVFSQRNDGSWQRIYNNDFKNLKPWKIELADIDGNGSKEILIAVNKTSHFDKSEKNRMFIFNYADNKLIKKWTGSEIAGIWENFAAGDFVPIKGDELVFIRQVENGERVSVYYWFDFGFLLLAESNDYEDILSVSIRGENSILISYREDGKERSVTLKAKDEKLKEAGKDQ
ncbi:MAG: hypothetical protein PHF63_10745 [Herbinix sp.]|nr:hypothetical protein [Herbinix sp.]